MMAMTDEQKKAHRERQKRYRERDPEKYRAAQKRFYERNPGAGAAQAKAWRDRNLEKARTRAKARYEREPETWRNSQLERRYGLTLEDYRALFEKQGETCAACHSIEPRGGRWVLDHCHETGMIRGILCNQCNLALGQVGDSTDLLLDLLNYLRNVVSP